MHATNTSRNPRASQDTHMNSTMEAEENRTPPSVRRSVGASMRELGQEMSPGRSERAFRSGNERLYEAYNDLHSLAQDFEKPFDAPAILVVGHQTDGKSGASDPSSNPKSTENLAHNSIYIHTLQLSSRH